MSQFNGLNYNGPNVYWNENVYFNERDDLKYRVDSLRVHAGDRREPATLGGGQRPPGPVHLHDRQVRHRESADRTRSFPQRRHHGGWGFYFTGKYFNTNGRLPGEFSRQVSLTLKTQYNITGDIKLSAFGILTDRGRFFGWKNRGYQESARFFLEGTGKNNGADIIGSLKLTHVLDPVLVL